MEFVKFKRAVHAQFNQLAAGADMLFLTNVDKDALWDCYLNSFPEEERQSHNCNNCKHYIRHYGRVVAIKDNKVVTMWENLQLDEPYATVARNLDALVKSKPVEDLWDLPLIQLDNIAIALNKKLQESKTESFIKTRTKDTTELELKFNIAKHIIDVKLQEQEDRLLESEKKAKRQKILDLMAKKQDAELEGKSLEELAKELEALN